MAPLALAADRVYAKLRRDLLHGVYRPGSEIVISQIARELDVSIAPVRDSVNRLVGERLLLAGGRAGYRLPEITAQSLHDLYRWHEHLVKFAVSGRRCSEQEISSWVGGGDATPDAITARAEAFFQELAGSAINDQLEAAIRSAGEWLRRVRLKEATLIPRVDRELSILINVAREGDRRRLLSALTTYHRRRLQRLRLLTLAVGGDPATMI